MAKKKVSFFLNIGEEEQAQMPVGAEFPRTGFIAGWFPGVYHKVSWCTLNIAQAKDDIAGDMANISPLDEEEIKGVDGFVLSRQARSGNFAYYYEDWDTAQVLCEILDREEPKPTYPWNSQQVWVWRSPLKDVLSLTDEAREKFTNDPMMYEAPIVTARAKKDYHKFSMLLLPTFVSAYAKTAGLDVPEFDVGTLTVPDEKLIVTDETQADLIGNADIGYAESQYWTQRTELWNALGEDNPDKWHTIEQGSKLSTESEELSQCLAPVMINWTAPVYARLIPVPDPLVDAKYKNSDGVWVRPDTPVVTEVYANKKAAVAAVEVEREARGQEEAVASDGSLQVPDIWKEYPEEWDKQVDMLKEAVDGVPPPAVDGKLKEAVEALDYPLGAEFDVIKAWVVAE